MNLVDSSGWLEYFADGPNANKFSTPLKDFNSLVLPTICIYEVFKVVLRERGEEDALQVIAVMRQGIIVNLTPEISLLAAKRSLDYQIPMADSIVLATALFYEATIWTQDDDFKGIKSVKYFPKRRRK